METSGILTSRKTQRIMDRGLEIAEQKAMQIAEQMAKKRIEKITTTELNDIKAIKVGEDGDFLTVMNKNPNLKPVSKKTNENISTK